MYLSTRFGVTFIALLFAIAGCGGGGGSEEGNTDSILSLSAKQASPGTFLTIQHPSIEAGTVVEVTFSDGSGYSVTNYSAYTENGTANIAVPVFADRNDGAVKQGVVTVKLNTANEIASLTILEPSQIQNAYPGEILIAFLQMAIEDYYSAIDYLDQIATQEGADNGLAVASLYEQISEVRSMIDELTLTGSLLVELPGGTTDQLSEEQLTTIDRILFNAAYGIVQELDTLESLGLKPDYDDFASTSKKDLELPPIITDPQGTIAKMAQHFKKLSLSGYKAAGGGLSALVSIGGLMIGGTPGIVLGAIGGVGLVVIFTSTELAVSTGANQFSASLSQLDPEAFNASKEQMEILKKGIQDAAVNASPLALPETLGNVAGVYSAGSGLVDFVQGTAEVKCGQTSNKQLPNVAQKDIDFCVIVFGETGNCRLEYSLYYVYQPPGGEITLSGDIDYPTITWSTGDGMVADEFEIEASYSANIYHLKGEIPNTVTYGEYGYPGTTAGEYCYIYGGNCTDVTPLTEESHFQYYYDIIISTGGSPFMQASLSGLREVCD